jgi:hypothetical protein
MTVMLTDLTSYRRTAKGKFGKEQEDSTIPSRAAGKEEQKLGNSGY